MFLFRIAFCPLFGFVSLRLDASFRLVSFSFPHLKFSVSLRSEKNPSFSLRSEMNLACLSLSFRLNRRGTTQPSVDNTMEFDSATRVTNKSRVHSLTHFKNNGEIFQSGNKIVVSWGKLEVTISQD